MVLCRASQPTLRFPLRFPLPLPTCSVCCRLVGPTVTVNHKGAGASPTHDMAECCHMICVVRASAPHRFRFRFLFVASRFRLMCGFRLNVFRCCFRLQLVGASDRKQTADRCQPRRRALHSTAVQCNTRQNSPAQGKPPRHCRTNMP